MTIKKHPLYKTWQSMRERCLFPDNKDYPRYGGAGITCCPEWKSFVQFFSDMGDKPSPQHTLDRIDNDGPYSPENCRWASPREQALNRSNARILIIEGSEYRATELSREYGVHRNIIYERASRGLPFHEVVHNGRLKWGAGRPKSDLPPRSTCSKGHELTPENIIWKDKDKTQRGCRVCHNTNARLRTKKDKNV